jgi:hypothetical protein
MMRYRSLAILYSEYADAGMRQELSTRMMNTDDGQALIIAEVAVRCAATDHT